MAAATGGTASLNKARLASQPLSSLAQRTAVAIGLIPLIVAAVAAGGWVMAVLLAAALGYAAWEYARMFAVGGYRPAAPILIIGTGGIILARNGFQFAGSDLLVSLLILITMTLYVIEFERGSQTSALDFAITVAGVLYLGWMGAYLVSIRSLPDGLWWLLTALPAVLISDMAAYLVGRQIGRHKLSRRTSPNKSWEGYIAGVIAAGLGTMLLAGLWHLRAPVITFEKGLILGLVLSTLSLVGDLGESMLKRSFGIKDSSQLLPGHGGIMDRVDSWLWAAPIGYYLIVFLWG